MPEEALDKHFRKYSITSIRKESKDDKSKSGILVKLRDERICQ